MELGGGSEKVALKREQISSFPMPDALPLSHSPLPSCLLAPSSRPADLSAFFFFYFGLCSILSRPVPRGAYTVQSCPARCLHEEKLCRMPDPLSHSPLPSPPLVPSSTVPATGRLASFLKTTYNTPSSISSRILQTELAPMF